MKIDGTLGVVFPDGNTQGTAVGTAFYAALGANVPINNTALYFDGPSVTLGTGKWLVMGSVLLGDSANNTPFYVRLTDGTTVFSSNAGISPGSGNYAPVPIFGIVTNPVGPVKIAVRSFLTTTGNILFNSGAGANKDSHITAVRIG